MSLFFEIFAAIAVIIGTIFSILGVVGYVRLPDVYARQHATGKVGVFGVVLLLVGAIALPTLGFFRGLLLIILLLITGPAVSHAMSSAAYRTGIEMNNPIRDDLKTADFG